MLELHCMVHGHLITATNICQRSGPAVRGRGFDPEPCMDIQMLHACYTSSEEYVHVSTGPDIKPRSAADSKYHQPFILVNWRSSSLSFITFIVLTHGVLTTSHHCLLSIFN
jgi:hypothetical protein